MFTVLATVVFFSSQAFSADLGSIQSCDGDGYSCITKYATNSKVCELGGLDLLQIGVANTSISVSGKYFTWTRGLSQDSVGSINNLPAYRQHMLLGYPAQSPSFQGCALFFNETASVMLDTRGSYSRDCTTWIDDACKTDLLAQGETLLTSGVSCTDLPSRMSDSPPASCASIKASGSWGAIQAASMYSSLYSLTSFAKI
jgi:hypothetical protein